MKDRIKQHVARITVEKVKELRGENYVDTTYLLYVKKGKVEILRGFNCNDVGFNCNDVGFKDMVKKIEEEIK